MSFAKGVREACSFTGEPITTGARDCEEVAEEEPAWFSEDSAAETEARREGKKVSQLTKPILNNARKAKRRNSALGAWLLHCNTIVTETDSVIALN